MPCLFAASFAHKSELLSLLFLALKLVNPVDRLSHLGRRVDKKTKHILCLGLRIIATGLPIGKRAVVVGRGRC